MARLAIWMPGRKATFAPCSGAWSLRSWSSRASLAKIRPSTRMPGLYDFGMRQQQASTCSSGPAYASLTMENLASPQAADSNIDDHLRQPPVPRLFHAQAVIRDRLHFVFQHMARRIEGLAPGGAGQAVVADTGLELAEQQMLGVEVIQ